MKRVPYQPCTADVYFEHLCRQQRGGNYDYFKGKARQRGYGGILGSVLKASMPIFKKVLKSPIAKKALRSGVDIVGDVLVNKKPVKKALATGLKRTVADAVEHKLGGKRKKTYTDIFD